MLNADSNMKTFIAFTDCTDGIEDLTQVVPLVQTIEISLPIPPLRLL